ncbi:MAG: LysE family transporter [Paracoccaceae bacterium]|nr:MAG: LysE family transporter [Paracoccaceae bacterium]
MNLPLTEFLGVWSFLAVNILSPGPNVLNTIATAMGGGRGAGLASAAGVGIGIGGWCLAMALGMATLFAVVPGAERALTLAAVAFLLWFAARYLRVARDGWQGHRRGLPVAPRTEGVRAAFLRSLGVNATNPKALTTWLAILAIFPVARAAPADIGLLCAGACALSFGIHAVYALAFSTPPAARFYLRMGWAVSGAAGLFFLGVAARLVQGLAG